MADGPVHRSLSLKQARYRLNQFRRARRDAPTKEILARAQAVLSPSLFELFSKLLPFEQAHAIRVLDALTTQGMNDPDLLSAALLHDIGKIKHPLRPWERAIAVLVKKFLPIRFQKWSQGEPAGLTAGAVVAAQHAIWGALLAAGAGANEQIVWLIAHHDTDLAELEGPNRVILSMLQDADSAN